MRARSHNIAIRGDAFKQVETARAPGLEDPASGKHTLFYKIAQVSGRCLMQGAAACWRQRMRTRARHQPSTREQQPFVAVCWRAGSKLACVTRPGVRC
jgi:hypothetical protein